MIGDTRLFRVIALADKLRIRIPDQFAFLLPQGKLIQKVGEVGIYGAEASGFTGITQYAEDPEFRDEGSQQEFKLLVFSLVNEELTIRDLPIDEVVKISQVASDFMRSDGLLTFSDASMDPADLKNLEDSLTKWPTHFTPLDRAVGGTLYQGILTLMGKPGYGKTSLILNVMDEIRKHNTASTQWFFQMEIPAAMLQWKIRQMKNPSFTKDDRLMTGVYTMAEILKMVDANPDPDRIVYIDGPDVMAGGGEEQRYNLAQIYRDMVVLKQKCKMVLCTSQIRRNDRVMSQESVAEAWSKAWYSDIIVGISRLREGVNGSHSVLQLSTMKNRFGPNNGRCTFNYNYADLTWALGSHGQGDDSNDW